MNPFSRGLIAGAVGVAGSLLSGLALLSLSAGAARERALAEAEAAHRVRADEVAAKLRSQFAARRDAVAAMADYYRILPPDLAADLMQMRLVHSKYKEFEFLFVFEESGRLLVSDAADPSLLTQRRWTADAGFQTAARERKAAVGGTLLRDRAALTFFFAPVVADGKLRALVGAAFDLSRSGALGPVGAAPTGGALLLATADARLVGSLSPEGIARSEDPVWGEASARLDLAARSRAVLGAAGSERLASAHPVGDAGLALVVVAPLSAPAGVPALPLAAASLVGLALAGGAAFALFRGAGGAPSPVPPQSDDRVRHVEKERDEAVGELAAARAAEAQVEALQEQVFRVEEDRDATRRALEELRDQTGRVEADRQSLAQELIERRSREVEGDRSAGGTRTRTPPAGGPNAAEEAEEADRITQDAIEMISKELSSSLTIVKGFVYKILTGSKDKEMEHTFQEFLDKLVSTTAPLERLMDDLVQFTRLAAGGAPRAPQVVDLEGLVSRLAAETRPLADAKRITFRLDVRESVGEASCDPVEIGDVVSNLLKNAIKYTPKQGRIVLEADGDEDEVRIVVQDGARGLKVSHGNGRFTRFEGSGTSLTGKIAGTGLRMPIMQAVLLRHGGRLTIEPGGDQNRFVARFPRHPPSP